MGTKKAPGFFKRLRAQLRAQHKLVRIFFHQYELGEDPSKIPTGAQKATVLALLVVGKMCAVSFLWGQSKINNAGLRLLQQTTVGLVAALIMLPFSVFLDQLFFRVQRITNSAPAKPGKSSESQIIARAAIHIVIFHSDIQSALKVWSEAVDNLRADEFSNLLIAKRVESHRVLGKPSDPRTQQRGWETVQAYLEAEKNVEQLLQDKHLDPGSSSPQKRSKRGLRNWLSAGRRNSRVTPVDTQGKANKERRRDGAMAVPQHATNTDMAIRKTACQNSQHSQLQQNDLVVEDIEEDDLRVAHSKQRRVPFSLVSFADIRNIKWGFVKWTIFIFEYISPVTQQQMLGGDADDTMKRAFAVYSMPQPKLIEFMVEVKVHQVDTSELMDETQPVPLHSRTPSPPSTPRAEENHVHSRRSGWRCCYCCSVCLRRCRCWCWMPPCLRWWLQVWASSVLFWRIFPWALTVSALACCSLYTVYSAQSIFKDDTVYIWAYFEALAISLAQGWFVQDVFVIAVRNNIKFTKKRIRTHRYQVVEKFVLAPLILIKKICSAAIVGA